MHYKDATTIETAAIVDKTKLAVFPVNNFLHSLFRQVTLTLNGVQIVHNNYNYPYKYMIYQLVNYDKITSMKEEKENIVLN